jgi:hypothetical protein
MIRKAYGFVSAGFIQKADIVLQDITIRWLNAPAPLSLSSRGAVKDSFLASSGGRIRFH